MNKNIIVFILASLILTAVASATVYETNKVYDGDTDNEISGVSVIGFVCNNDACTSNTRLWANTLSTGRDNEIILQYPTDLKSDYGYLVYFFKPGYVPYKVSSDWNGEGNVGPYNNYLYKIDDGSAPIEDFQLSKTQVETNEQVTVTAKILAPRVNSDDIEFIPAQLKNDYYSDKVKVTLYVNQQAKEIKNINMPWDTEQNVEFTYTPTDAGTYSIQIQTVITDSKFSDPYIKTEGAQLNVDEEANPEPIDTTAPLITIVSPEDREYDTDSINFEITANENLHDAWFVIDGDTTQMNRISNARFSEELALEDGDYEVEFYAEDIAGNIGRRTIEFSIDSDNEDEDDDDSSSNHRVKYVEDKYYQNKYFDQFDKTESVTSVNKEIKQKSNLCDNEFYWIVSIILVISIIDLIALIFVMRKR